MKCPYCGTENADNAIYCKKCDQWIMGSVFTSPDIAYASQSQAPEAHADAPKRKRKRKIWLLILAAVCALLAVIIWLVSDQNTPEPTIPETTIHTTAPDDLPHVTLTDRYVTCLQHMETTPVLTNSFGFLQDTKVLYPTMPVEKGGKLLTSMDGMIGAYLDPTGELMHINGQITRIIASDVSNFCMTPSGNAIAYVTGNSLYLFKDGTYTHITDISIGYFNDLILSENGEYIAVHHFEGKYITDARHLIVYHMDEKLWQYHLSATSKLLWVDNEGQWVYLKDSDTNNVIKGNIRIQYADGTIKGMQTMGTIYGLPSAFISADGEQLLIHAKEGTYLALQGQLPQLIASGHLDPLYPALTSNTEIASNFIRTACYDLVGGLFTKSADGQTSIYYLNENLRPEVLVSNVQKFWLDPTGQHLYYTQSDGTFCHIPNGDVRKTEVLSTNATNFVVCYDLSAVYYTRYVGRERELHKIDQNGDHYLHTSVSGNIQMMVSRKNTFCYLYKNTLYFESQESIQVELAGIKDSGILYVWLSDGSRYGLESTILLPIT